MAKYELVREIGKSMAAVATRIDRYELRRELARTATSTVYDGWDSALSRRVAVKIVDIAGFNHAEVQNDLARFRQGAHAAGRLVHVNIAGVYDYGETEQQAYLVMEFIDGPTLQDLFDDGHRFDLQEIGRTITALLQALQYSHDRDIVHRDIKPGNVMFTAQGGVKLTDFGIARIENSNLTRTGTVMGTPAYMSPEQFLGERVDWRSDIYSVGVTLYHMLTGERPFDGSIATIMHKVMYTTPVPPSRLSSVVSPALDEVVIRAMARNREDRFASCADFEAALHSALRPSKRSARQSAPAGDGASDLRDQRWRVSATPTAPPPEPRIGFRTRPSDLLSDRSRVAAICGSVAVVLLTAASLAWLEGRKSSQRIAESTPLPMLPVTWPNPQAQLAEPAPPAAPASVVPQAASPPSEWPKTAGAAAPHTVGQEAALSNAQDGGARARLSTDATPGVQTPRADIVQPPAADLGSMRSGLTPPIFSPLGPQASARRSEGSRGSDKLPQGGQAQQPREDPRKSSPSRPPVIRETGQDGGSTLPAWISRLAQNGGTASNVPAPWPGVAEEPPAPEVAYTSVNSSVGLVCRTVTAEVAANLGLDGAKGMEVVGVTAGGVADRAGIRSHDVILSIAGVPTRDSSSLPKFSSNLSEPRVPVELWREGKRRVVQLDLEPLRR
jgi:serine/threonine-protein kinase